MKIVNRLSIGSRAPNLFQAFYFFRRGHPSYRSPIQVHGYLQPYSYAFATSFHMSIEVITSNSFGNALNIPLICRVNTLYCIEKYIGAHN